LTQTNSDAGESDSEVTDDAVIAKRLPSALVLTMQTPDANRRIPKRKLSPNSIKNP